MLCKTCQDIFNQPRKMVPQHDSPSGPLFAARYHHHETSDQLHEAAKTPCQICLVILASWNDNSPEKATQASALEIDIKYVIYDQSRSSGRRQFDISFSMGQQAVCSFYLMELGTIGNTVSKDTVKFGLVTYFANRCALERAG